MFERESFRKLNIFLILFFGASFAAYFLLNGPAYARIIRYSLFLNSPFAANELKEGDIFGVTGAPLDLAEGEFALMIPKISVTAPIIAPRSATKEAILTSLEYGVGLYPGSQKPGEQEGRSIILGHSSRASWYRGDYATIFALLPELQVFDEFFIVGDGKKYVYRVFAKDILSPDDANRLFASPASGSEVVLITCYPIGSASKRIIVRASLVSVETP